MMKIASRWGLWLAVMALALAAGSAAAGGNPDETKKLIGVLQSDASQYDKGLACRRLAQLGTAESIPVLAKMLADEKMAHLARFGLETNPEPAAGAALRGAMGSLQGKLLIGVINSVGMRRDAEALDKLVAFLKDADAEVAAAAAAALSRIANPAAVAALTATLQSPPAAVKTKIGDSAIACAEELKKAGKKDEAIALYDAVRAKADMPVFVRQAALQGAILTRQDAGAALVVETLAGNDPAMAAVALRAARLLPGAASTQALAGALGKLPAERQALLVQALGDRRDATALPALAEAAKSGAPAVRLAAVRVLGRLGDASAVPILFEAAAKGEGDLASAALTSLTTLPGKDADPTIVAALGQGDAKIRCVAISVASQRQIPAAVPALLTAAKDADAAIRLAALGALKSVIGAADLAALVEIMVKTDSAPERTAAQGAISAACTRATEKQACAGTLLAALPQASPEAKCALLELLAQVGGEQSLTAVRAASIEAQPKIRETALRALCDWSTPEVMPDLIKLSQNAPEPRFKILALRGQFRVIPLMQVPAAQKLAAIQDAMGRTENAEEKYAALAAMGKIPTVEALDIVTPLLTDPALQEEAASAAVAISREIVKTSPAKVAAAMRKVRTTNPTVRRDSRALLLEADPTAAAGAGKAGKAGRDGAVKGKKGQGKKGKKAAQQ